MGRRLPQGQVDQSQSFVPPACSVVALRLQDPALGRRPDLGQGLQCVRVLEQLDLAPGQFQADIVHVGLVRTALYNWAYARHNGGIHRPLLTMLGFALGEMWALEELAADCADDGVYEFLLTAKPLHLPGGAGSPANALAIK